MNKKGFTLIELLAVVAIIGILSLVAIPNIIGIVDNIRKDNMLDDAKRLISLARMEVNGNYEIRVSGYQKMMFNDLNKKKDLTRDPDDGLYDSSSYVEYKVESGKPTYCVYLKGSKRKIEGETSGSCVMESDLVSNSVVK